MVDTAHIAALREFNRFYTARLGMTRDGLHRTSHPLAEARVLYELGARGELETSELRAALAIDAGQLSRLLRRLEEQRLVRRVPSPDDGRRQRVALTPAGEGAFERLDAGSREEIAALLDGLPDPAGAVAAMRALRAAIEGTAHGAGGESRAGRREGGAGEHGANERGGAGGREGGAGERGDGAAGERGHGAAGERGDGAAGERGDGAAGRGGAVVLRDPRPGDLGWLVARHGALYTREYGWDASFERLVAGIVAAFDPRTDRAWIAHQDGRNLGAVLCVHHDATTAKLRTLLVEPEARGLGVGTALVDAVVQHARQRGYATLTLWTNDVLHAARRIYERAGFTLEHEAPHHAFGHDLIEQTWSLTLTPWTETS